MGNTDKNIESSCYYFEESIASFMHKYALPVQYNGNNITDFIADYSKRYISDLKNTKNGRIKLRNSSVYDKIVYQAKNIEETFNTIIEIINDVNVSQYSKAEDKINKLFENYENNYIITGINGLKKYNVELYRVREKIEKPNEQICNLDLFHVPVTKRNIIKNERFSISGQPCLYLSTELNIAWKESGFPLSFYYSKYEYDYKKDEKEPWKFLFIPNLSEYENIFILELLNNEEHLAILCKYLRTFPIMFACSIISRNKVCSFKEEYIFPQLVMQWVRRNIDKIKGIIYFSCVDDDSLMKYHGYNIVLPATDFDDKGYSKKLIDRFNISNPKFENSLMDENTRKKIIKLFDNLKNYTCYFREIRGCIEEMFKIFHAINIMIKETENTSANVLLVLAENISKRIDDFFYDYQTNRIINDCRNSDVYQSRYEKSIEDFKNMYDSFNILTSNFTSFFKKLNHESDMNGVEIVCQDSDSLDK